MTPISGNLCAHRSVDLEPALSLSSRQLSLDCTHQAAARRRGRGDGGVWSRRPRARRADGGAAPRWRPVPRRRIPLRCSLPQARLLCQSP